MVKNNLLAAVGDSSVRFRAGIRGVRSLAWALYSCSGENSRIKSTRGKTAGHVLAFSLGCFLFFAAFPARLFASDTIAATTHCDPRAEAPAYYRAEEDCRSLGRYSPQGVQRSGLQRLKYLPISASGKVSLTFGAELRWRHEYYDPPRFGLQGGHPFSADEERFLADADLRGQWFRFFIQIDTASESGWPQARPFDHSAPDLSQGFFELSPLRDQFSVRIGRQELDLPGNRLVGVNDPAGIRRAFDGLNAVFRLGATTFDAFDLQPVLNQPGAFDDTAQPGEHFAGLNVHHVWVYAIVSTIDVFIFRRERQTTFVAAADGQDRRDTWGTRLAGQLLGVNYSTQLDVQRGSVGAQAVRAKGSTLEMDRVWNDLPGNPTVLISAARASGDRNATDGMVGSFDPLYPNLSYSTDAGYLLPSNIEDVSTSLALKPSSWLSLQSGLYRAWRVSRADAVYQPPGYVLIPPGIGGAGRIADLPFATASAHISRYCEFSISAVRLIAGPVIKASGGRNANYVLTQSIFRF